MEEKTEPEIHVSLLKDGNSIIRIQGSVEDIVHMLEGLFAGLKKDEMLIHAVIEADGNVGLINKALRTAIEIVDKRVNSKPGTIN